MAAPPKAHATKSNWKIPIRPQLIPPIISNINAILSSMLSILSDLDSENEILMKKSGFIKSFVFRCLESIISNAKVIIQCLNFF